MSKYLFPLSFLFFLFEIALATNYFAGSSYFYDFPKCSDLNITLICSNKIDLNEFYFSPNCNLVENQTFINKWVCSCFDGYVLNFTINPASKNNCDIFMVYRYAIELPEAKREIYTSSVTIFYNTTYNTTLNQTLPKEIVYINKTVEVENKTKIEELNQVITQLNKSISEKEIEMEAVKKNLLILLGTAILSLIICLSILIYITIKQMVVK